MDIYLVDRNFKRVKLFQNYESFIWTERYSLFGDFEFVLPVSETFYMNEYYPYLAFNESDRFMMIETKEFYGTGSKKGTARITGRSLEAFLLKRPSIPKKENRSQTPSQWMIEIMGRIVGNSGSTKEKLDLLRFIYNYPTNGVYTTMGTLYPTLYDAMSTLAAMDSIGWKLVLDADPSPYSGLSPIRFEVYSGTDRSVMIGSTQPVKFSTSEDTFTDTTYLYSIANAIDSVTVYYNDAADSDTFDTIVTSAGSGFQYRSAGIDAGTLGVGDSWVTTTIGRQYLKDHYPWRRIMDGTPITVNGKVIYKKNYNLGDIVLLEDNYGNDGRGRVTEHTWSIDTNGMKTFPTFETL